MSEKTKSLLSKLPDVKDHQSKEMIYQQVQNKMKERGNNMKKSKKRLTWVIPSFATGAVVVLSLFLLPGVFDQPDDQSESALTESSADSQPSNESATTATLDEEGKKIVEDPIGKAEDNNAGFVAEEVVAFEHYTPAMQPGTNSLVFSFPDQESLALIPLTFQVDSKQTLPEQIQEILSSFDANANGFGQSPLADASIDVETLNGSKTLVVDFPTPGDSLSSNESILVRNTTLWLADSIDAENINWKTNGEDGYMLGNFGPAEQSIEEEVAPYFLFETETDSRYLAKGSVLYGESATDLESVLSLMKDGDSQNSAYIPSIPEGVSIDSVEKRDDLAVVTFTEDSTFTSEEEAMETLEAIMLTAAQFGYNKVSFLNTGFEKVGPYSFYEAIEIPQSPNAISLSE
ncbi:GerMN domain-containing protein [Guptibacillus algicola]|uniref:GerMN domain-containing protein n=1 Tax=Guptibacillus algicola TaxID=225844 RepID=UPI001CD3AAFA|nr:GerMN domain-containing protein [Alkalihalobacillus algicola]MCA0989098.1 GerMN domain-containing protein [Alkalihalobacillus algicola]